MLRPRIEERKVALPEDILVQTLPQPVEAQSVQPAPSQPDVVTALLAPVQATAEDAIALTTDFGAHLQQIRSEEAQNISEARDTLARTQQAFGNSQQAISLIAQGQSELIDRRRSDGLLQGLFNLVDEGPGKFFRDELGITERRAQRKIAAGNQMLALSQAQLERDTALAEQSAAINRSLLRVGSRSLDAASDVTDAANKQRELRQRDREAAQSEARLNFDIASKRAEQSKAAVANLMEGFSSNQFDALATELESRGLDSFTFQDPLQVGLDGKPITVTVPTSFIRQKVDLKRVQEATLQATLLLEQNKQEDAARQLNRGVLAKLPVTTLRKILVADGQFSVTNPNDSAAEPMAVQFNLEDVNEVLKKKQGLFADQDAAFGALTNADRLEKIQQLGPDATLDDIAAIPTDPETDTVLESMNALDQSISRVVTRTNQLFDNGTGIAGEDAELFIGNLRTDSAELNQLRTNILLGRVALTDETKQKIDEATRKVGDDILVKSRELAKRFGGGNEAVAAFAESTLLGQRSTPRVAADAFVQFALQPDSGTNATASKSTRNALEVYNKQRLGLYNQAIKAKGIADKADSVDGLDRFLESLTTAKKAPVLTKEERAALDMAALEAVPTAIRNQVRTGILTGDLSALSIAGSDVPLTSLANHPFLAIRNLRVFDAAADQASDARLRDEKLDINSSDAGVQKKAQARKRELFFVEYAKLLVGAEVPTDSQVQFKDGLAALEDFLSQPAFRSAVAKLSNGIGGGNLADQASAQLFGQRVVPGLEKDFQTLIDTAQQVEATQLNQRAEKVRAFKNDGFARLDRVLTSIDDTIVNDQEKAILVTAIKREVERQRTTRIPGASSNTSIASIVLNRKLQDPQAEEIRKRVAKEWETAAFYADRHFFIDNQTAGN